jgi:hypothetical protein
VPLNVSKVATSSILRVTLAVLGRIAVPVKAAVPGIVIALRHVTPQAVAGTKTYAATITGDSMPSAWKTIWTASALTPTPDWSMRPVVIVKLCRSILAVAIPSCRLCRLNVKLLLTSSRPMVTRIVAIPTLLNPAAYVTPRSRIRGSVREDFARHRQTILREVLLVADPVANTSLMPLAGMRRSNLSKPSGARP